MNISCNIIEDLLPLYHDDVCSADSKTLVDEHLRRCDGCKQKLLSMDGEVVLTEEDKLGRNALENIRSTWKKSNRKALIRGIAIAMACIGLVCGIASGIWYWQIDRVYDELSAPMIWSERGGYSEEYNYYYANYEISDSVYSFELRKPDFLSTHGSLTIIPADSQITQASDGQYVMVVYPHNIRRITISPQFWGTYQIRIEFLEYLDEDVASSSGSSPVVYIDSELNPINCDQCTDSEIDIFNQLVETNRNEILSMLFAAEGFFRIDFLENASA